MLTPAIRSLPDRLTGQQQSRNRRPPSSLQPAPQHADIQARPAGRGPRPHGGTGRRAHHQGIPVSIPPLSDLDQATRAAMISLLDSGSEALAGYPAATLIRGCWRPRCGGVSARGCTLASSVLQVWIRQLEHDLRLLLPGSGPELARMRHQTAQTRDVLARLQDCVNALQSHRRMADQAAAATHGMPAAARCAPALPQPGGDSSQQPEPARQTGTAHRAIARMLP